MADPLKENNFGQDLAFLKKHLKTVVLRNDEGGAIAVVPAYQGRTMTSTAGSESGKSYGYVNYDAIASDIADSQTRPYGGEDYICITPQTGQNSVVFDPSAKTRLANWRTPNELGRLPFKVQARARDSVSLSKNLVLTNWNGTRFYMQIDRSVKLLTRSIAAKILGVNLDNVQVSAHESHATLINRGETAWQAETGLIGIRLIGMSKPAPKATRIASSQSTENELPTAPSSSVQGVWDPGRKVLSVISCNLPVAAFNGYNNAQENRGGPCDGDALKRNGENVGEIDFFQTETASPALALAPDEGYTHIQRTIHIEGFRQNLSAVAKRLFGADLDQIESHFDKL